VTTHAERQAATIGHTVGLAAMTCSAEHHRAEQVYVRRSDEVADPNGTHPITIDAWVGYGSVGVIRLTRKQAADLLGVIGKALAE
jgi:hypothetical protein